MSARRRADPSEKVRTFACDNRGTPLLHNAQVRAAFCILADVRRYIDALDGYQYTTAMEFAVPLRHALARVVERDAACFEAAALLFAGLVPGKDDT